MPRSTMSSSANAELQDNTAASTAPIKIRRIITLSAALELSDQSLRPFLTSQF